MRVVVLQHESIEGPGVWMEALLDRGASVECVLVPRTGVPAHAGAADLVISMGGSMSVNDPLPWIAAEAALLAERIRTGAPVLGVCLGSQLIAKAGGGVVEPGPVFEIGFHEVELTDAGRVDPVMRALPPRLSVLQWHGEYFRDIPGATAFARSSRYPMQAFRVANAYGLLFHLEATLHSVAAMCDAFPQDLRRGPLTAESLLDDARRRLAGVQCHAQAVLDGLLAIR
jgi:GMP synthase-like glutamine amidotransferase